MRLITFSQMKREKLIMTSLVTQLLKVVVVEAVFKVLEDLIVPLSQIFLRISLVILEVALQEDRAIEEMI